MKHLRADRNILTRQLSDNLDRVLLSYGFNSYRLRVNKLEPDNCPT